eukprot:TRINITY_DN8798_c0_g1_i12.p2 TRINITY_DN8798_c0_g1~~TRINITY_DN8798_c0_g1_i12.p2  ORF type:complete len:259 (-),score=49.20 TRINITY_DN8798_c0_g1_i12:1492-2268(-)
MKQFGEHVQGQRQHCVSNLPLRVKPKSSNPVSYPATCVSRENPVDTFSSQVSHLQHPTHCRSLPKRLNSTHIAKHKETNSYTPLFSLLNSQDEGEGRTEESKESRKTSSRFSGKAAWDCEELPKTGIPVPMEMPFDFPRQSDIGNNELGPAVSSTYIQQCQRDELNRLVNFEYGTAIRRLVFDLFERRSAESYAFDTSFASYGLVCAGKGAPSKSFTRPTKYFRAPLKPFYRLQATADSTLVFESRFELGNLRRAVQV